MEVGVLLLLFGRQRAGHCDGNETARWLVIFDVLYERRPTGTRVMH